MPGEAAVPGSKARPVTTRSSIRQSLNLASVSKAFADVINKDKDPKDAVKHSKKAKDSRRLSTQAIQPAPRPSMGDTRSLSQATNRTATPESKGSTRRRMSALRTTSDEQPTKPESGSNTPKAGILTRAASLRAQNLNTVGSSLPKYRPRAAVPEQHKPPSPLTIRAGIRRPLNSSDESEKEEKQRSAASSTPTTTDKGGRPISPLPQRASQKTLNKSPTPTSPTPTKKPSVDTPTLSHGSPSRPTKTSRTSTSTSAVPRPSSSSSGSTTFHPPSSSSSSGIAPQTPQTPVVKAGHRRVGQDKNQQHQGSAVPYPESPSPPARHVRSRSDMESSAIGNMSHISERAEDEDEEGDVELLLAPVARLGAPTPAMPRIQKSRSRKSPAFPPKTPSRRDLQLPTRANMSYLSPLPPNSSDSALLRPPQPRPPAGNSNARSTGRGSILSWEQLASEASKTLGEDDLDKMLHDIPAPFLSGAASPAFSTLELPASPCLSALDSPTGYGSISQVLLPDVTPSPAMHPSQRYTPRSESSSVDSPASTLLRLQLAQAEHIAKERLMQMQTMEEEIHNLKEMHTRQMQESARHIAHLEANERNGERHKVYALSLEDRLRQAEVLREQAVKDAERRSEETARRSLDSERRKEKATVQVSHAAKVAASEWSGVRDLVGVELDLVRGDRAVLSVLLAELNRMAQVLSL